MSRPNMDSNESTIDLYNALLSLKNQEECEIFLRDLFTVQEIAAFSQRLQVAKLLYEGNTYDSVRKQIQVSSSTITRINTVLRYGPGGYKLVIDRMKEKEEEQ